MKNQALSLFSNKKKTQLENLAKYMSCIKAESHTPYKYLISDWEGKTKDSYRY